MEYDENGKCTTTFSGWVEEQKRNIEYNEEQKKELIKSAQANVEQLHQQIRDAQDNLAEDLKGKDLRINYIETHMVQTDYEKEKREAGESIQELTERRKAWENK